MKNTPRNDANRPNTLIRRISRHGTLFSTQLDIDLTKGESEWFKWLLAAVLYGKRISQQLASKTYRQFQRAGVLSPQAILNTGWDGLVQLLDAGGYVRYDFSTATRLLQLSTKLEEMGGLAAIHNSATTPRELETLLMKLPGVGPTTSNIFLREMRDVWEKADPEPSDLVKEAASNLSLDLGEFDRKKPSFVRIECGLLRIAKDFCKKRKCPECPFSDSCRQVSSP